MFRKWTEEDEAKMNKWRVRPKKKPGVWRCRWESSVSRKTGDSYAGGWRVRWMRTETWWPEVIGPSQEGCGGPVGIETWLEETQRRFIKEMEFVVKGERRNGRARTDKGSFSNDCHQGIFVHQWEETKREGGTYDTQRRITVFTQIHADVNKMRAMQPDCPHVHFDRYTFLDKK